MTRRLLAYAAVAIAAVLPGCGNTADKTGGSATGEPRVLRLANSSFLPYELQVFADEVARRSGGSLRIEFANQWRDGEAGFEAGIVDDVARGKADLGWVGARVLPELGAHGFDALLAPFLIDSYALELRAIEELGGDMLAGLEGLGVRPFGVLPGPIQRVIAREPVQRPVDLAGRRLLTRKAEIQRAALRALGAEPVDIGDDSLEGSDGAVDSMIAIAGNSYGRVARYLTADLGFWPRPSVLFASPAAWARMSRADREVLSAAAVAAAPATAAALRDRDAVGLEDVCSTGARLVDAGRAGRAAMRSAVDSVYARLREDALTARRIDAIERMGASIDPDTLPRCAAAPRGGADQGGIPSGTYVWTYDAGGEVEEPPVLPGPPRRSIRFRLVIAPGHLVQYQSDDGAPEEIGFDADYTLYRDRITTHEGNGAELTMRWSFDGRRLRFTDIGGRADDKFVWGSRPWVKDR
jgi:TRAP-type C4-dicarboxylate transport system substrate-binding protein